MYENQERHFVDQNITFRSLWGRPLQLIDCQNVFCEISKYARAAFPDYAGVAGRTRIKQKFKPAGALPAPWYPPKWNINGQVAPSKHLWMPSKAPGPATTNSSSPKFVNSL
jgi:hypothetical protein